MTFPLKSIIIFGYSLFLPVNIYTITSFGGIGVQGLFYRYQITDLGKSFIGLSQDIFYVINGMYSGKSALSVIFWSLGAGILIISIILAVLPEFQKKGREIGIAGLLIMASGCILLISIIIQYGFLFNSASGIAIPFGVPMIIGMGYLIYIDLARKEAYEVEHGEKQELEES